MFRRIAFQVILSAGWRRRLIAFLAGACGALALPPLAVFPALAVTFTLAVWLIDGSYESGSDARTSGRRWRHARKAAAIGWWLGFGYFLAGLWWLGKAFLVEADQFAWALPLGVIGLPAVLAFFTAFGFWLSALMWSGHWTRISALSLGAGLSEWLRAIVLTGFPWNDFGMALGGNIYLAQPAAFIGLHGLTFIAIVLAAAPATLVSSNRPAMNAPRRKRDWLFNPATAALAIVI
ncbi:MAG: apolipoprotein N-acyltransferase, partial [Alphaproteobacteria bacterium]|nr:apolipoprotein N-acyltransferase [Alphaproteobacteria bacterium]